MKNSNENLNDEPRGHKIGLNRTWTVDPTDQVEAWKSICGICGNTTSRFGTLDLIDTTG